MTFHTEWYVEVVQRLSAGEEMRGAAERIEHEVTTADCRVAGRDKRPGGLVRVTLTEALA